MGARLDTVSSIREALATRSDAAPAGGDAYERIAAKLASVLAADIPANPVLQAMQAAQPPPLSSEQIDAARPAKPPRSAERSAHRPVDPEEREREIEQLADRFWMLGPLGIATKVCERIPQGMHQSFRLQAEQAKVDRLNDSIIC